MSFFLSRLLRFFLILKSNWFKAFRFIIFAAMKKRQFLLNFSLVVAVLFSIVFQSADSIGHLQEQFYQKECHHTYSSKSEITHQHHNFEDCIVCHFGFSSFVAPIKNSYSFFVENYKVPYFFSNSESVLSFSGSLYSLRGPPNCI